VPRTGLQVPGFGTVSLTQVVMYNVRKTVAMIVVVVMRILCDASCS